MLFYGGIYCIYWHLEVVFKGESLFNEEQDAL